MKFPAIFGFFVGFLMIAQWAFFFFSGQVPEIQTEPISLAFHLAAEISTALGLIIFSYGLVKKRFWAIKGYLVFTGMLLYSVIVSPGYFAQSGQWRLVTMFAGLLILAIVSILRIDSSNSHRPN